MTYFWPARPICSMTYEGRYYDQMFTSEFFHKLLFLMDVEHTQGAYITVRNGHYKAFSEFTTGEFELANFQSLKDENKRLEQVAKDAEKLRSSLAALYEYGRTQTKLRTQIETNTSNFEGYNGHTLVSILDHNRPDNPFLSLREYLSDLHVSAKRARVTKPKPKPNLTIPNHTNGDIDLDALEELITNRDWNASGNAEIDEQRWRKRAAEHMLPKDHAMMQFVTHFKATWEALSPHAFTQGHYYEKIGHEPSLTVAAILHCFTAYGLSPSPQSIVTAIRKVKSADE